MMVHPTIRCARNGHTKNFQCPLRMTEVVEWLKRKMKTCILNINGNSSINPELGAGLPLKNPFIRNYIIEEYYSRKQNISVSGQGYTCTVATNEEEKVNVSQAAVDLQV